MRINKLIFKNIASYKGEYEIDFEGSILKNSGIFLISGNTGSGKSTILDCITLALYARIYRLDKNVSDAISKGLNSAYARLTFTVAGKVYESFIELNIKQKETPKNMVLKCLSDNSLIDNRDDVLVYIKSLCRLDFEQFCQTVILPQGHFQEFLTSKPKSKTAIIDNIFNLKKYDDIEIFLKRELEVAKLNKEKLEFLETEEQKRVDIDKQKLNEITDFLGLTDIEKSRKSLESVYKQISICEKIINSNQKYLDIECKIDNLKLELSSKFSSKESLDREYSLQEENRTKLGESLKFYNSQEFLDLNNFIKRQGELLNDKERLLHEYSLIMKDLLEFGHLDVDNLNNFDFDYIKELYYENVLFSEVNFDEIVYDSLLLEDRQLEDEIEKLLIEQSKKNVELKSIALKETTFDLDKYIYYEALKLLKSFTEELICKYRSELELLSKTNNSNSLQDVGINIQIGLYKEILEDLNNNNQSVNQDIENLQYLEAAYNKHQGKEKLRISSLHDLLELNSRLQGLQSRLDTIRSDIFHRKENKIKWESQVFNFNRNNAEILKRIGKDLFNRYIDYSNKDRILIFENKFKEAKILKLDSSKAKSKIVSKDAEMRENLDKIRVLLSDMNLNMNLARSNLLEKEFESFLKTKKEIEGKYLKVDLLLNNINSSKIKLESQIEFMVQTISALKTDFKDERDNLNVSFFDLRESIQDSSYIQRRWLFLGPLDPSKDSLHNFLDLKSNLMSQIESLSRDISNYETNFSGFQTLKKELLKQESHLRNIKNELSSVNERNEKLEIIKKVVATSPSLKYYVQSFLIDEILSVSNKRYLSVILPDFELEINTDSKDFDFLVKYKKDGNTTRSVKTLSGGEKFLVSLSLSLALSDMIRDSELKIEAFFLDEGFGSLDEDTLKMVIPKIAEFQRIDGRQIGIISHVAYLKEEIKSQIIINKISKISNITVESL
ncbi:SMC family ATPase [Candidatus Borreliella tachyglossi]|uniref:SMC family ATPase n=1 Tax=Candidatus Borreliella tachyglossi TaxID=1964448 RepID=A0A2S1LY73_9SPIR|nr:SMC family ATPase [Candidatus Borreliella tachyglossi]